MNLGNQILYFLIIIAVILTVVIILNYKEDSKIIEVPEQELQEVLKSLTASKN